MGAGALVGVAAGVAEGAGGRVGVGAGDTVGAGVGSGTGADVATDVGAAVGGGSMAGVGVGVGVGAGRGEGVAVGPGAGTLVGVGSGVLDGAGMGVSIGPGTGVVAGVRVPGGSAVGAGATVGARGWSSLGMDAAGVAASAAVAVGEMDGARVAVPLSVPEARGGCPASGVAVDCPASPIVRPGTGSAAPAAAVTAGAKVGRASLPDPDEPGPRVSVPSAGPAPVGPRVAARPGCAPTAALSKLSSGGRSEPQAAANVSASATRVGAARRTAGERGSRRSLARSCPAATGRGRQTPGERSRASASAR